MKNPHPPGCFWHNAAEMFGPADVKYCEQTICHFISEPWNTWSNLPIILVGLVAIYFARRSKYPWFRALGLSVAVVGLLSFIYHLSNNFLTQLLDYLSMYLFIGLVAVLGLHRRGWIEKKSVVWWYIGGFFGVLAMVFTMRYLGLRLQYSIVLLFAIMGNELGLSKLTGFSMRPLLFSFLCFLLAITSQVIAVNRFWCTPDFGFIEMHVFWHLFNAAGLGFYLMFCFNIDEKQYLKVGK